MIRITLAATLFASVALATPWTDETGNCYSSHCQTTGIPDPIKPPNPEPKPPVQTQGSSDRDPVAPVVRVSYGVCCVDRGKSWVIPAFGMPDKLAQHRCSEELRRDWRNMTCTPDELARIKRRLK